MKSNRGVPFLGTWYVALQEYRIDGKWHKNNDYDGDIEMSFFPDGYFVMDPEMAVCYWTIDPDTSIIIFYREDVTEFRECCVFESFGEECWFYFCEVTPYISLDRSSIISHHAYERWRVVLHNTL